MYIKHLTKKLELLQVMHVSIKLCPRFLLRKRFTALNSLREQPHANDAKSAPQGSSQADPRDSDKIAYATASVLIKVFEAKCERQGWSEPEGFHKDALCTKIRQALQVHAEKHSLWTVCWVPGVFLFSPHQY